MGIDVTGTLGGLVAAKHAGRIDQVGPLVQALQAAGMYMSEALIRGTLRLAGELD